MVLSVPGGVEGGVAQAEVRGQVDHQAHPTAQLGNDALGLTMRQGTEHEVESVEQRRVVLPVRQSRVCRGQRRGVGAHRLAGVRVGCGHGDLEGGMHREEAQQLRSRVPRGPDDPGFHRISIH